MNAQLIEYFLARLYSDPEYCQNFVSNPETVLAEYTFTEEEKKNLLNMDREGLILASGSYERKRARLC